MTCSLYPAVEPIVREPPRDARSHGGNVTRRRPLQSAAVVAAAFLGVVAIRYFGSVDHLHAWAHALTAGWIAVCAFAFSRKRRPQEKKEQTSLRGVGLTITEVPGGMDERHDQRQENRAQDRKSGHRGSA